MILDVRKVKVCGSNYYKNIDKAGLLIPSKALLIPKAADSIMRAAEFFKANYNVDLNFSDMFRTASEQIVLKKKKGKGASYPGFSGHNFGMSVDIHTNKLFAQFRCAQKPYSLRKMRQDLATFGWSYIQSEEWHFNYLNGRSSVTQAIDQDFGENWTQKLSVQAIQEILHELGYYNEEVDGLFGTVTKQAVQSFQTEFCLEADGKIGPLTRKVLVVSTMRVKLV